LSGAKLREDFIQGPITSDVEAVLARLDERREFRE